MSNTHSEYALGNWIEKMGITKVAKLFQVTETCVRCWRRGHSLPRDEQKYLIKRHTKGQLDYDTLIEQFFAQPGKKKGLRNGR